MQRLADMCLIKPPKAEARKKLSDSDFVTFAPMENLGIGQKKLVADQEKPFGQVSGSYTYFAEGDVLLAKITPCFENGKLGIAEGLTNGIGFGSSEYIVFRPSGSLCKEYLYYFLDRDFFREEGEKVMSGAVGHKRVPKDFIENYLIPVPPLPEQRRIVGILDEAFEGIAKAKAHAEANLQNARALFESHLQSVFTQQGPGWVEKKLGAITSKIGSGATPRGGQKAYKSEGTPLIRSLNVHDRYFREKNLAFIDDAQAAKLSNVVVKAGDVLLNITGASVARCCLSPCTFLPARVNQHVSIIRPLEDILLPAFLCYLLTSKPYKDKLLQTGIEGGATRQAITKAQIEQFSISFPESKSEQQAIVTKLDELAEETKRLEGIYRQKLAALDELKQSLLHKAFSGEL